MNKYKDQKKNIAATFNDVAAVYDSNRFFEISAAYLVDLIVPVARGRMLDVACGTGNIALSAAKKYPGMSVTGLDISNDMLHQAQKKAEALRIKNVRFINSDIDVSLKLLETFDIITCGYGLFFFPDIDETFKHLHRLLNPGGQFLFSSFTGGAFTPFTAMFRDLLKEYGQQIPELSRTNLENREEITDLCLRAGANPVHIKSLEIRYPITIAGWWSLLNSAGYKGLINGLEPEARRTFKARHLQQVKGYAEEGTILLIADSLYGIVQK